MEVAKSTIGIFYISRLFGLAPYLITRSPKGFIEIRRSIILSIYSVALITTLILLTYRGLLFDAGAQVAIRASFRMKSATSKVVTALDVSVVVFVCLTGVICGLTGLRQTQEINLRLREADETLSIYCNNIKDRRRGNLILFGGLLTISILLVLDIWSWFRTAAKLSNGNKELYLNVQWYIPFYSLYYILMGLHIQFAQSALGLGRRYRRLNLALKNSFLEDGIANGTFVRVTSLKTVSHSVDVLSYNNNNQKKVLPIPGNVIINGKSIQLIDRLAYTHASLGRVMQNISGGSGLAVLFMLGSCLLHLVATSYFLILVLLGDKDAMFSWLQLLWILFHVLRLLLIVEPCHVTAEEAKRTLVMVCEMERICRDQDMTDHMRLFWQQLLSDRSYFSACGMCTIDRQILTSISGALATYLVILIQFQKTDG